MTVAYILGNAVPHNGARDIHAVSVDQDLRSGCAENRRAQGRRLDVPV